MFRAKGSIFFSDISQNKLWARGWVGWCSIRELQIPEITHHKSTLRFMSSMTVSTHCAGVLDLGHVLQPCARAGVHSIRWLEDLICCVEPH